MDWYIGVLKNYAVFSGRARRKEYWFFVLFNVIISLVLALIDVATDTFDSEVGIGLLGTIYGLAVMIPSIAVLVRRLHDTNRSAWWILIAFVPLIGVIVLIVFMFLEGNPDDNDYGENPKFA